MIERLMSLWRTAGSPPIPAEALDLILNHDDGADVPPDVPRRYWGKFRALRRQERESRPAPRVDTGRQSAVLTADARSRLDELALSAARTAADLLSQSEKLAEKLAPPITAAEAARRSALGIEAQTFAAEQIGTGLADPAERDDLAEMFRLCSEVDRIAPPSLGGASMLVSFRRLLSRRSEDETPPSFERTNQLLSLIPSGQAAIDNGLLKRR